LAGVFLEDTPRDEIYAEWIVPDDGFAGDHMFVTDGQIAFDFHGYCNRDALLVRYWKRYRSRQPEWNATITKIDFPLLCTDELNARQHRGPDQYFGDPIPRARKFIASRKCPSANRLLLD
jgi:hypothetical protein